MVFDETFRLAPKLSDFDSSVQFERFVKANTEVALFLGGVYARRKRFDFASSYETLTFEHLKQYEERFATEGKDELRNVAAKEIAFWTAWIESREGFTRQYANHEFRLNTDYAKIVKPERAMSRDDAAMQSYGLASAMLKPTGYTPAWLSEFTDQKH